MPDMTPEQQLHQSLDDLITKLHATNELVSFGVRPIEACSAVFGPDIAERTKETLEKIEQELRDAGYDIKLR